jgi:signal transduction histidine kinase
LRVVNPARRILELVRAEERCPACDEPVPAFRALSDAVLAMAAERSVDDVLQTIVEIARRLVDAKYAAIGIPDGEGGFAQFITDGMSAKQWDAIGELPRQHGLLGAMLEEPTPFRTTDIRADPRFQGWPSAHPTMRSFLGVPIVSHGRVIGAFYLTDKRQAAEFTAADEGLIVTLAAHTALAIENARLYERSRELTVIEERNRLARELHDSVTQTLFGVDLAAEAAALLVASEPDRAREQISQLQSLARDAMEQLREIVFELRPADLGADGLVPTLRKHVGVLRRVHGVDVELEVEGEHPLPVAVEREVFRVAQEALANALRHADARTLRVRLAMPDHRVELVVADDGRGFDPLAGTTAGRHLGLVSMRERAEALGGSLEIESRPGEGTTVSLEVVVGDRADPSPRR